MEKGYFPAKMKRKNIDDVYEDFSDFSLSSPARKIRRLDAELAPIMEEEEVPNPVVLGESVDTFAEQAFGGSHIAVDKLGSSVPENEERAIVLFNPMSNTPLLQSRSPLSFSVDKDLISGFRNPVLWSNGWNLVRSSEGEREEQDGKCVSSNGCLAVVPWVPSHTQCPPMPEISEMMDADDMEAASMDIEDNSGDVMPMNEHGATSVSEGLNQWQQHCMVPQPPHNLSTPVTCFGRGRGA